MPDPDLDEAHKHSHDHRAEVETSDVCGCFHCTKTYVPIEITEWVNDGSTALCPKCGIDSVIGSNSGLEISERFLRRMRRRWFGAG